MNQPSRKYDLKKVKKNNPTIALNVLYAKKRKKKDIWLIFQNTT